MDMDSGCAKWGFGCLTVILIWHFVLSGVFRWAREEIQDWKEQREERVERERLERDEAEKARRIAAEEAEAAERRRAEAAEKAKAVSDREERLRAFTLKEAPVLWRAYQELNAQIESQAKRIEDLRKSLLEFQRIPENDSDFKAITVMRQEMIGAKASLRRKIEDAYLAYIKFEATPSRKDYDELRRKILEDGVMEADAATRRFTVMRKEK